MKEQIEICALCARTDAFTPGAINHDNEAHKQLKWFDGRKYKRGEWLGPIVNSKSHLGTVRRVYERI